MTKGQAFSHVHLQRYPALPPKGVISFPLGHGKMEHSGILRDTPRIAQVVEERHG